MKNPGIRHGIAVDYYTRERGKLFLASVAVGLVGGLGAVAFRLLTRVATYAALVTLYARTNRNALSSNPRGVTAWIDFGIKTWI